jgi:LAO/AO transport system kinase
VHEKAFIRPSPASGNLGGVASHTREAMLVCEAAGNDIVIVETVGVGQSEIAVAAMTDMFVLMQLPNAGDDLQAIKKGVMELADLVVINKADVDPDAAIRAQAQIVSSMRIFEMHGHEHQASDAMQRVLQLSALKGTGLPEFWLAVRTFQKHQQDSGQMLQRRQKQAVSWMWERIESGLKAQFRSHPQVQSQLPLLTQQVLAGELAASTAARKLLLAGVNTA